MEHEWRETARWVKFEEDVEEGGNRWSKPHVATLSLHSLFELRSCLLNGTILLEMEAEDLPQIVGKKRSGLQSIALIPDWGWGTKILNPVYKKSGMCEFRYNRVRYKSN